MERVATHLARLGAWTLCIVATTGTELRLDKQRKTVFSTLYERYLLSAGADTLKMAWQAVKAVHAAKFDSDGIGDEEGRELCGNSWKTATVAM